MMPEDQMKRALEFANSYDASAAVRVANRGLSEYRRLEPQLRELQRIARQSREAADYPRYLLIRTFTFARGGWHDAPLLEMPASQFKSIVDDLVDKPNEEVKKELDAGIPTYFRHNDHAALRDMIDGWNLFPEQRRRMVEDAFEAHKCGKYTLSVSALTPQIEGILRDETGKGDQYMWEVNKALDFQYSRKTPSAPPSVEKLKQEIKELLTLNIPERWQKAELIELHHALFRVNELYNRGDFWNPEFVNSANRHAISHGVFKDFSELTSIKLFCSVQLVHEIVEGYRKSTGAKPTQT